ncbi:renin-like protein, partial [Aphelenchoides avenae]
SNETERVVVVNGTAVVDVWHGIFGPLRFIEPLAKSIGATFDGIQEYFVDCDKRSQFPILNFHINGHVLQLKGMEYTYQPPESAFCYLSLLPNEWWSSGPDAHWIVGTHFLANHCFVADYEHDLIGFVEKKK